MEDEKILLAENPFAAPTAIPADSQSRCDKMTAISDLRVFVGSKAEYYVRKWGQIVEENGDSTGFNWAAFFLSGLWLGYRKMYLVMTIFYTILLVESLAEEIIFVGILGREEVPESLGRFVSLVTAVVCGMSGNRWYLRHARKVIADVRGQSSDEQVVRTLLTQRGGTSVAASLGALLLFTAIALAAYFVLETLMFSSEFVF